MPNTQRGFPYPSPADPVAQGAAAIQALAEANSLRNRMVIVDRTAMGVGSTGLVAIPWTGEYLDDWNGFAAAGGSHVFLPSAGRYRFTAEGLVTGQTGGPDGSGMCLQMRMGVYAPGPVAAKYWYGVCSALNGGVTICGVWTGGAAGYSVQCEVNAPATGAGGTFYGTLALEYLGPVGATLLRDGDGAELLPAPDDGAELEPFEPELRPDVIAARELLEND